MTDKKILFVILIFSICLSILGFFIDGDPRNPDIMENVYELCMMTILQFGVFTIIYYGVKFIVQKIDK